MGIAPGEFMRRVTVDDLALILEVKRRQAKREEKAIEKARAKARAGR